MSENKYMATRTCNLCGNKEFLIMAVSAAYCTNCGAMYSIVHVKDPILKLVNGDDNATDKR